MDSKKKKVRTRISLRTIIGIIAIALGLLVCFVIAPWYKEAKNEKVRVVMVKNNISEGSIILEEDLDIIEMYLSDCQDEMVKNKKDVVGKYAKRDLYKGEYINQNNIIDSFQSADYLLSHLDGKVKAISVTISSYASGLSGKLRTNDIVSINYFDVKSGKTITPEELTYVRVIICTTNRGVDLDSDEDYNQPATITLMVNKSQQQILCELEKNHSIHCVLEYRGKEYQKFLDKQNEYFDKLEEPSE